MRVERRTSGGYGQLGGGRFCPLEEYSSFAVNILLTENRDCAADSPPQLAHYFRTARPPFFIQSMACRAVFPPSGARSRYRMRILGRRIMLRPVLPRWMRVIQWQAGRGVDSVHPTARFLLTLERVVASSAQALQVGAIPKAIDVTTMPLDVIRRPRPPRPCPYALQKRHSGSTRELVRAQPAPSSMAVGVPQVGPMGPAVDRRPFMHGWDAGYGRFRHS